MFTNALFVRCAPGKWKVCVRIAVENSLGDHERSPELPAMLDTVGEKTFITYRSHFFQRTVDAGGEEFAA